MSIIIPENKIYTVNDIYHLTNNGLSIFEKEIEGFTLDKNISNPFCRDDNPSARIKQSSKSGLWLLYTYNEDGKYYTAISFLQKKYGLNLRQTIDYIINNHSLNPIIYEKPKKRQEIYYSVNKIPFTQQHIDYFCIEGITEEFLNEEMDIFSIDYYYINGKKKVIPKDQFMFAYEFRDDKCNIVPGKYKLLTLNTDKKNKWRGNILPFNFFYAYKIKDGDTVFVVKSNKDCIPLQKLGVTAIATMSENRHNIIEGLKLLIKRFPNCNFIINMGSDPQGKATSLYITKELELLWFNTPNSVLSDGINDNWEYVKKFGLKAFENLLKHKKFL